MPLTMAAHAGSSVYANPFVGPVDHTIQLKVDISELTTDEVDADGFLKPGVPFADVSPMVLIGGTAAAGTAVAAAVAGNTGNGTMGAVTVSAGAKAGVHRLTIVEPGANVGTFIVEDPDGVIAGSGVVAAAYSKAGLAFTLADGATDFASGDAFTITVTLTAGGAEVSRLAGVTIEPVKLPLAVLPPTNTTLDSETGDCFIAICTHGIVNRDIAEDNLGRAYTAAELAAFNAAGSHIRLTQT